ncbi:bifunctional alpha,alpha-trehalose-phosphate synthase (UDP-forming)/trehalose-phosphatase [Chitinophaga sancti]|uniref:Bifunctional alpha,alpha-trehalose-phosphate synthase (UDP-forming)/trehalose-phosphatase n=1 Tax=Chitinophaga sancti TaxID=1004 RepID=A0A1K1NCK3_9BACT|nr:bifunctional alpha,alpha-trehalose-phosphate synthase (UDP-forming)/trehalose-phosphatase [Chitinophaga sancti]WQD63338.1 bifunctional alpha,alpha-trehalose-phosphate synthase (UDP-forming)/trehalose-phosphatase [Chitinophaga sancti]WQG91036.1 bifunctional alpha,alpha-trehalose-phosphate synthase (UDP-forming)/trehalose-phosphatase [Chitinophaga sancti]SFW33063.1 trehalose 6-phosphate synthase /trehalose 6-phosphatase [Chitinophaga sancti]
MSKTIIVSNRLPVKITEKEGEYVLNPSEGGLATGLGSIYRQGYNIWIGWPGVDVNEAAQVQIKEQLGTMNLMPVYLTQDEINNYYEGFSNEVLWPVFHYMSVYARYEQVYWDYYYQVNTKFRDAVLEVAAPGDVIWIHDYQLLLLPGMIRAAAPDVAIGYFQHIPFPSFELFRLIPWRVELLEGMLGADLLGFHTFDDSHHFLNAVTRLLPLNATANVVTVNDRAVVAETFPMGIDNSKFELLSQDPEVLKQVESLRENFHGTHMVLSIDRLDYSKGIIQRLQAFELFLQLYPEYIEKVVLYMIVVPSRDTVAQYKELREAIDMLAGGINARFRTLNWHPINYFYRSFPVETLSALYSFADVGLVTPMRDGMNLVSKEYVASRKDSDGVLILSEMAGASKELIDALIVNPNNIGAIARGIHEALNMPEGEQRRRMKQMQQIVSKFNISHWVKLFMARLQEVKQLQQSMLARRMSLEMQVHVRKNYKGAKERVIFLDYDGTLVGFQTNIDLASPDQDLIQLLTELTVDPLNHVVMVSGRKYQTLEEWLGHLKLDLIAEHGAFQKRHGEEWQQLPGLTDHWKADIAPILETFTDRTPGSFIEEKSFSLVWHYRKAEAGLGELRANELMNTLRYFSADKGLQLLPGDKVIEVKNVEINKGKATLSWLQNKHYDFTLAIGDDHTDEDIFKALPQDAVTIKVGSQVSSARFYLRNHREVRAFLKSLILV